MNHSRRTPSAASLLVLLLASVGSLRAEAWPALEDYVEACVLVVQARVVVQDGQRFTLEVEESWKGRFVPSDHAQATPEGRIILQRGHGLVDVEDGQTVILFFTKDNQPPGDKLVGHSTAFPVHEGKIVYAPTGYGLRREYRLEDFKQAIADVASKQPRP